MTRGSRSSIELHRGVRMSDGSELWARTIPDLLTAGAVTLAIVMLVGRRVSRGV
jgi:hypothetical protein